VNDKKRGKKLEMGVGFLAGIYISLIIPVGFFAGAILAAFIGDNGPLARMPFMIPGLLTFAGTLCLSVIGLFKGSRLLRRHLLLWYGCLFTWILTAVFVDQYIKYIDALAVVILLVLPVIWLWKALRS